MAKQMDRESSFDENHGMIHEKGRCEPDRLSELGARDGTASQDLPYVEKLLMADWGGLRGRPLPADELLAIGREAFEPLFHEPPIGPIPEYLIPHSSVYGCVAEYEEKLEELDRWKALELNRWLKDRIGMRCRVAGKVYELQGAKEEAASSEKYRFRLIEERAECGKLSTDES